VNTTHLNSPKSVHAPTYGQEEPSGTAKDVLEGSPGNRSGARPGRAAAGGFNVMLCDERSRRRAPQDIALHTLVWKCRMRVNSSGEPIPDEKPLALSISDLGSSSKGPRRSSSSTYGVPIMCREKQLLPRPPPRASILTVTSALPIPPVSMTPLGGRGPRTEEGPNSTLRWRILRMARAPGGIHLLFWESRVRISLAIGDDVRGSFPSHTYS